jgi:hypothetical protein
MDLNLPLLIKEKIKYYKYQIQWKEKNKILIKQFKEKVYFTNDGIKVCDQDEGVYLCFSIHPNHISIIADLHNDETQRFNYRMDHLIYYFGNPNASYEKGYMYKSRKHYHSSGCECPTRLCPDPNQCPSN